jgi:alkylation response protein AidB-like acyl-CoA dehydrogenase
MIEEQETRVTSATVGPGQSKQHASATYPAGEFIDVPWALSDEHIAWRKSMREFADSAVKPGAQQRSEEARFDPDVIRAIGQLGVFGLLVDGPYGAGADLRTLCIAIEELAYVDSSVAATAHVQACNAVLFHALTEGRDDLREEVLPDACAGNAFISFGLTEPSGGSDAGDIQTRAARDGDDWVINGAKQFITNTGTPMSRYVLVFAATQEQPGDRNAAISAFLVPLDAPGVTVSSGYKKLGWRASDTHPLFFDNVRVPRSALLGKEGHGLREALRLLTWARIPIAAMAVGLSRACLDGTVDFVNNRRSFGKRLGEHQSVAFTAADMAADVATARLVTYDAAWKFDNGYPFDREAAVAKLLAGEIANKVAYQATELHGGYGFMQETDVVRHYQDARILTIGEGTSAVQRLLLSRSLGLG